MIKWLTAQNYLHAYRKTLLKRSVI